MPTYKIKIDIEHIIKASDEGEAWSEWENDLAISNSTLVNEIVDQSEVVEVCPHCEEELKSKMFNVDGKNLEEHNVCEKCGYGTPALL